MGRPANPGAGKSSAEKKAAKETKSPRKKAFRPQKPHAILKAGNPELKKLLRASAEIIDAALRSKTRAAVLLGTGSVVFTWPRPTTGIEAAADHPDILRAVAIRIYGGVFYINRLDSGDDDCMKIKIGLSESGLEMRESILSPKKGKGEDGAPADTEDEDEDPVETDDGEGEED